ncbi:MAG: hypothetical protein LBK76_04485 [Verrucomicrobiales bacterium]|jgi:hypothetical protein|nr:hypothetical protein [Verrucomicrobiales bacterium]
MKITLGNTVIVDTLDQVSGVWPELAQDTQVAAFLRGDWKRVWPRGNRLYTLPLTVWDPPHASVAQSMVAMFKRLQDLPVEGVLTIEENGLFVESPHAVMQGGKVIKRVGLSDGYQLTLLIEGPLSDGGEEPVPDTIPAHALATLTGEPLATLAGDYLVTIEVL